VFHLLVKYALELAIYVSPKNRRLVSARVMPQVLLSGDRPTDTKLLYSEAEFRFRLRPGRTQDSLVNC